MNKRIIMVTAPIVYVAAILAATFINTKTLVAVTSVGALLLGAVYTGLGLTGRGGADEGRDDRDK